jgi:hypothetical protein
MISKNGFKWPKKGPVACDDWDGGKMVCGGGLHGLENGEQSGSYLDWSDEAVWLVVKVRVADGYATGKNELTDKCKFRKGTVVYCGKRDGAVAYLVKHGADPSKVVSGQATASGHNGVAFTGYDGFVRSRHNGAMAALWWDNKHNRPRIAVAYVGENGIKPDTWYKIENGVFVEIKE